ncbi:MAG: TPR end-of-group domain-containing protein [Clostridium perfringens]
MAVTYKEEKNYKKAIEILNKGLEFNEEAFLYYNRGCNYINLKDNENSLKDVKKSIELNSFFIEYSKKDKELEEIWDKI